MRPLLFLLLMALCVQKECMAQDKTIDSLRLLLSASRADTSTIKALDDISYYYRTKLPDTGIAYGKRALLLAEKDQWKPGIARTYNCIGNNYVMISDATNSLAYHQKALELYQQLGDQSGIGWSLGYIGSVYIYILSDYKKAAGYVERSIGYFEKAKNKSGLAMDLDNLGIIYETMGDNNRALKYFQEAEIKYEELGNKSALATTADHLAILYTDLTDYPRALDYCRKAETFFKEANNKTGMASILSSMGSIYLSTREYPKVIQYEEQSAKIYQELGNKMGLAQCFANLGLAAAGLRNYTGALGYYQQSFKLEDALGYKSGITDLLCNMGYVYINAPDSMMQRLGYGGRKRYVIAERTVNASLNLAKEIGDFYIQRFDLKYLSEIYAKKKDFASAYETYKKYQVANDSILTDEKQKQITHKEFAYEYSKKEALLKAEQDKKDALAAAEISKQKIIRNYTIAGVAAGGVFAFFMIFAYNKRKKANFEKQVSEVEMQALRLQMNPHFIFNCMHSINKYVIDNEKSLASEFLIRFSKLMRLILENSREKLVPVKADLLTLEMYMQLEALRFKNKFQYSIHVDPAIDTERTLIPPMMLQPFVENSIVHGIQNRTGGLIKITIGEEGNMIRCTVEDNGIGRKQAALFKSATNTKRESLGVKITGERLQIISKEKKVKTAIFMEDLKGADNSPNGLRVQLLLPLEMEY